MTAKSVKFLLILFGPGKFQLVYEKFPEVRWNGTVGGL